MLTWCGWWGWWEEENTNNQVNTNNGASTEYIVQVKAWPVEWAKVYIKWPNWEILYTSETNWTGYFKINKGKLEEELKQYGYDERTYLKVETEGWIDIDPNDDGIYDDERYVRGKLLALLKEREINGSKINPLSTLIWEYLEEVLNKKPSKEELDNIGQKLWYSNYE